jgi:hypothetical protein
MTGPDMAERSNVLGLTNVGQLAPTLPLTPHNFRSLIHPPPPRPLGTGNKTPNPNYFDNSEKFVTRREYDEIKDSLNRLENFLTTNPGSSASTTEEVAAAVNMVKSKAVLLSKVVASPQPGPPPPHLSSRTSPSLNPHASLSSMSGAVSGATNNNSVSLNPNPSLNLNMNMGLNPNPNNNPNSNHPNSMMLSSNVKGLNDLDSSAATAAAVARVGMLVGEFFFRT